MASIDPYASSDDENDALLQRAPVFKRKINPQPTPAATHSRTTTVTPVVASVATAIAAASPPPVAAVVPQSAAKKRVAATTKPKPKPKKNRKCDMPHCLIWLCTHGKGRGRAWSQSKLKIVGVYSSKAIAEEAKRNVMSQHECCGHGDILVGCCWDDEIDLVIREAPMMLTSDEEY